MKKKTILEPNWTTKITDDAVLVVDVPVVTNKDWSFECLLLADVHIDSKHCNEEAFKELNQKAIEDRAAILVFGDMFDAMQGKFDKRGNKGSLKPKYLTYDYLDTIVEDATEIIKPYAKNYIMISEGNHETSVRDRHEVDLIKRLNWSLNKETGANIWAGPYLGFIKFRFTHCNQIVGHGKTRNRYLDTVDLVFSHGSGKGAVVTDDALSHQRMSTYLNAQIYVTGHTHDFWSKWKARRYADQTGKMRQENFLHIKIPTLKDGWSKSGRGWEFEKGLHPKVLGSFRLKFFWDSKNKMVRFYPVGIPENLSD